MMNQGAISKVGRDHFQAFEFQALCLSPLDGQGAMCRNGPRASTAASHLTGTVESKWDLVLSAPKAVFLRPGFLPSTNDPALLIQVPKPEI